MRKEIAVTVTQLEERRFEIRFFDNSTLTMQNFIDHEPDEGPISMEEMMRLIKVLIHKGVEPLTVARRKKSGTWEQVVQDQGGKPGADN